MTTICTGLDIAKLNLQLHLAGRIHDLPNTATGHRRLCKLVAAQPGGHVICEATGGYERDVVAALQAAKVPVSILNPARVRHFARAQVRRALYMAALVAARSNQPLKAFYQRLRLAGKPPKLPSPPSCANWWS